MEPIFIAILFGAGGGSVLGYWLSSHIHSVASAATSNAVVSGAASAITGAISTVQSDIKAIAAKIDHIVVSAPTASAAPGPVAPAPYAAPAPATPAMPAAGPIKVP